MVPDREAGPTPQCWLYRCDDCSPFAFSHCDDFIRWADHTLWARLRGDQLLSVASGECIASRVGGVFYDPVSHEPIYYQRYPDVPQSRHAFGRTTTTLRTTMPVAVKDGPLVGKASNVTND